MPGTSHFIQVHDLQLHCLRWGSGPRLLVAFHGYGNDAGIFSVFASCLPKEFTLISVDLPHHGRSDWHAGVTLSSKMLCTVLRQIMQQQGVNKASLLGYSIGGRVCLSLVEHMPGSVDKLILLSPDGLVVNGYYFFLTRTAIGRQVFHTLVNDPSRYMALLDRLHRMKIISHSQDMLVKYYLGDEAYRRQLGVRWPALRELIPSPRKVKQAIKDHNIPVELFMGRYDKVIPVPLAEKFIKGLETAHLHILEKGHRIFDHANAALIARSFL